MSEKKIFELSSKYCLYNGIAIVEQTEQFITFGMLDPENIDLQNQLCNAVRMFYSPEQVNCRFEKINREQLEKYVSRAWAAGEEKKLNLDSGEHNGSSREQGETILFLDSLLQDAVAKGVTDIHIDETGVRFRTNGILVNECSLTAEKSIELIRRIKVLSRMNVMEKRKGQDGQFVFTSTNGAVFVRSSCIPVISDSNMQNAEAVVLRILNPQRIPLSIKYLGFNEMQQNLIEGVSREKSGLVLICGPTGSGKSTTAAAILELIKKDNGIKKIITVEDPPEYILKGITQIKVDEKTEMDFDQALRFVFRHDPDVIFVGEIRDSKSAMTALRASLTGHLVFATVHTDGFFEAVMRLVNLGIDLSVLCRSLRGMIVQNLEYIAEKPVLKAKVLDVTDSICESLISSRGTGSVKLVLEKAAL